MEEEITIDHCPETENGEHQPDRDGYCSYCMFYGSYEEWWDHIQGA